jgi:hypothetical protein
MKSRVSMILLIVLGSFCVYCVQNGARPIDDRSDGAAGPVGRAAAQTIPGTSSDGDPGPTLLFDEVVAPSSVGGRCASREIDITGYRMVVVHRATTDSITELKLGEAAGFVPFLPPAAIPNIQVIDPQLGRILRFSWGATLAGVCGTRAVTVVGYRDPRVAVTPPPPPPATAGRTAN